MVGTAALAGAQEGEVVPSEVVDLPASWKTQTDARTIVLSIPGPRGQIVDRNGFPFAQNKVSYYLSLNFPFMQSAKDADVLRFAHNEFRKASLVLGGRWAISDEDVLRHYEHRRWLPLAFPEMLKDEEVKAVQPITGEGKGLVLTPAYTRIYPRGKFASHIIGYVGKTRPLPVGTITNGDPLFPETEGRDGLEKAFDEYLQGTAGRVNHLFDSDGQKIREYLISQPRQGDNVVTTLDLDLQTFAEEALQTTVKRGAFVIIEIKTGDILAMASWPMYDPNEFIPYISQETWSALVNDNQNPMFARAFCGIYPPASTYKVPVALAALETETVDEWSEYGCPSSYWIGNRSFKNWNKNGEGSMNVVDALARSCNTWFYQVGMKMGAEQFLSVSRRLGLGEKTGLPIYEEAGNVPDDGTVERGGTVANLSIGQGALNATPLQVARMMAAVGDGEVVRKPRLVRQIQDINNKIVKTFPPEIRNNVNLSQETLRIVRQGMYNVVHAGNGTGRRADIEYAEICGKTGTGQWVTEGEDRRVAWFAGFLPRDKPKYAFATLYEGGLGETVSGGRLAAPMVHEVFTRLYENEEVANRFSDREDEVDDEAEEEDDDSSSSGGSSGSSSGSSRTKKASPPPPPPVVLPPPPPKKEPSGLRKFWNRLRGRG